MRRSNAPTLQTVADEAGVTAMMASVVLNGARSSTRVSETTRARILEAALRLGYRRNAAALGLNRRNMNTLGVISVVDGNELNLYFLEVLNGVLEAAAEHAQNTTVFSIGGWEQGERRILDFCDGRIDGMILIGPIFSAAFAASLHGHTPFVTVHSNIPLPVACSIDVDNEGGAYAMTRHLLALGHRRLAHFSAGSQPGAVQRQRGYERATREAGLAHDAALVLHGEFSIAKGRAMTAQMLQQCGSDALPTAIFCASDAIAYGCMETLAEHNIIVPDQISVAGFDDSLMARMTRPPLTTARQPFRQMGHLAVEKLLQAVEARNNGSETGEATASEIRNPVGHSEIFDVEVVVRESTAPPHKPE